MKYIIKLVSVTSFLLIFSLNAVAQIAINSDGSSPDASAMLEITSSNKGLLIPRMTTSERTTISSPATGLLVYDTDANSFWYYANAAWVNLSQVILADADNDTKIQVEESSDEDIIRFDLGGTEFMRLDNGQIEVLNTGNSVFLGEEAGANDDLTDNYNTFIGYRSGNTNTTGESNAFLGTETGSKNTSGTMNAFIGDLSGFKNTTGNNNTFLGGFSGYENNTGANNIFIGYQSGFYETGSNKLYIESSNALSPLIYGEFDNNLLQINGTLNIKGNYSFPTTDGNATQILSTDGSGTITWTDFTPLLLSDADADTKIQVEESSDEDIIRFDLNGTEFFKFDNGRIEVLNTGNSVFIGAGSGTSDDLTTNKNVFVGDSSGYSNTTGDDNIFTGFRAGFSNDEGNANTFIGANAGYSTVTGDSSIFIGYHAGYSETSSNKLYIENSDATSPLIYGEFDNDLLQINGTLNINGAFEFPTTDGSANQLLTTDGSGTLSWSAIDNTLVSDVDADTKIQVEESSDEDIIRFDLGGAEQMQLNSSELNVNGNIVFGTSNLYQLDEGGWKDANITLASGDGTFGIHSPSGAVDLYVDGSFSAKKGITIGNSSTYTFPASDGSVNQFLATDGSGTLSWTDLDNTLLSDADADTKIQIEESSDEDIIRFDLGGTEFMKLDNGRIEVLNTGNSVFIGEGAGTSDDFSANENVFIGYQAGYDNTSGTLNTFIGANAGFENTTAVANIFIGSGAGYTTSTGSYNLFVGNNAGYDNTTGTHNTFLGLSSGANNTTGTHNVYLGLLAGFKNTTGSDNVFLGHGAGYNETGSDRLYIDNSSATSPLIWGDFDADKVVINGNDGDNSNNRTLFINGSIGATSSFNNDSDRRLKKDIQTIPNALDKILEMRGVTYQWKDGRETGDRMGFIAQEVEPILPQVVDNENDHYTMQYAPITAVLVEAVKEQQTQIETLQSENKTLKQQVAKINQLETMLLQLQVQLNNQPIQNTAAKK